MRGVAAWPRAVASGGSAGGGVGEAAFISSILGFAALQCLERQSLQVSVGPKELPGADAVLPRVEREDGLVWHTGEDKLLASNALDPDQRVVKRHKIGSELQIGDRLRVTHRIGRRVRRRAPSCAQPL